MQTFIQSLLDEEKQLKCKLSAIQNTLNLYLPNYAEKNIINNSVGDFQKSVEKRIDYSIYENSKLSDKIICVLKNNGEQSALQIAEEVKKIGFGIKKAPINIIKNVQMELSRMKKTHPKLSFNPVRSKGSKLIYSYE